MKQNLQMQDLNKNETKFMKDAIQEKIDYMFNNLELCACQGQLLISIVKYSRLIGYCESNAISRTLRLSGTKLI